MVRVADFCGNFSSISVWVEAQGCIGQVNASFQEIGKIVGFTPLKVHAHIRSVQEWG
jgi:hypothetical protein